MKPRLLVFLPLLLAASCHVELLGDLEVQWSINGQLDSGYCTTYNIGTWRVVVDGPERYSWEVPCGTAWETGTVFYSIVEGSYSVTVEALDTADQQLAYKSTGVSVIGLGNIVDIDFVDADFQPTADYTLNVFWNINGTEDGTPKGQSWDSCDEVGAAKAVVSVDGVESEHDCHASGKMSAALGLAAAPVAVQVWLEDASGNALTTKTLTTPGPTLVTGKSDTWEYVAEFFFDSFSQAINGDYLFATTYDGGKSCSELTPPATTQITLLKLNGNAVTAQICGPDNVCVSTNGADFGYCYNGNETQDIADQEWGNYQLKVSGGVGTDPNIDICWEDTFDILIGAGTSNPVDLLDVKVLSGAGGQCL
jgi:hypothetical protein